MNAPIAQAAPAPITADLILFNGNIHTMDANYPTAQAVAIIANRIAAVGASENIRSLAGPRTRSVNLGGRLLLPGFNDAHVHFLIGGFQLSSVDLRDASTHEEFS